MCIRCVYEIRVGMCEYMGCVYGAYEVCVCVWECMGCASMRCVYGLYRNEIGFLI